MLMPFVPAVSFRATLLTQLFLLFDLHQLIRNYLPSHQDRDGSSDARRRDTQRHNCC
jgi:hypothetical protein